jgi:hypothetical protein
MNTETQKVMMDEIVGSIDIPDSAYEKAEKRYESLGNFFKAGGLKCSPHSPHIYSQGSFRLGTVNRPLNERDGEYDLDVGCRLTKGITKVSHTQSAVKGLLRIDLEAYRKANGIQSQLEEKSRCWRLQYADEMKFHMDVVPSIPEEVRRIQLIQEAMVKNGRDESLARMVAHLAGAITDNERGDYHVISADWRISNSEGYARWFESQARRAKTLFQKRLNEARVATVEELPARKWKLPLQRCVQILKRHRDSMFENNPDGQPISVIITTLAAEAYQGEETVESAMQNILNRIGGLVRKQDPRVPNPVNPAEDFADKWPTPKGLRLSLEANFWSWLEKAKTDFGTLGSSNDVQYLVENAKKNFGATLNAGELKKQFSSPVSVIVSGLADKTPKSPVNHQGGGRFG